MITRVTRKEKELLGRIYGCVNRISALGPRNPADIAGLSRADLQISRYVPRLASAISNLGFGDLDGCAEDLDDAEAGLGVRR
jgi:hypothetical protein